MTGTTTYEIQPHNETAAKTWGAGGVAYDEISRGIADAIDHCVERLAPHPGEQVLDVATGTGWTSRVAARRGATVVGVDIAAPLLDAARDRAALERLAIDYQLADAEQLPFDDGSFDAVVSTFGVMFVARPERAAAELARVCRRGGRVALTTWTPTSSVARMFGIMRRHAPVVPAAPQPSPFEWGRMERLDALLGDAFDLQFERGVSYYRESSAEMAWETFSRGYGPARTLAARLDDERRAALRDEFIAFHAGYPTELGICVPREYWLTIGRRR